MLLLLCSKTYSAKACSWRAACLDGENLSLYLLLIGSFCGNCATPFCFSMTILNVDDDLEDIEIFCDAVREIDASIICLAAKSAEEAWQILDSDIELPQYIFLDINMPKVDGNVCLKEIKQDRRLRHIPVIMYSTYSRKSDMETYKELNAGFLVKQSSYNELVAELKKVLGGEKSAR
jgi:CheY-like chemotaxis protein